MIKISINTRDVMEFNTRSLRSLVLNSITSLVLIEILIMTRANYLIRLRKLYSNTPIFAIFPDGDEVSDEDEDDHDDPGDDIDDEDELDDEFDDYGNFVPQVNTRIITTVPAKEPSYNAVPLKSALKKPRNGIAQQAHMQPSASNSSKSNSDSQTSSSR